MLVPFLIGILLALNTTTAFSDNASGFSRYRYNSHHSDVNKRQSQFQNHSDEYFPVIGVADGRNSDGSWPVRKEIRQLEKDQDLWTLYLLGLDAMQASQQEDPISWYKIMGIHGMPYESWDQVAPVAGNEKRGYCTHMSVLFLSWHRPYLALYEQILYSHIQFIASQFEEQVDRGRYVAAARRFRIPYWDWAAIPEAGQSVYPRSIQSPSIDINGPAGFQTIANPLYAYAFHPLNNSEITTPQAPRFEAWNQTLRSPSSNYADAVSQDHIVADLLTSFRPTIQTRLYNLFAAHNNYTTFSNAGWIFNLFGFEGTDDYSSYDSIESIHDLIHGVTGNGGHMQMVDMSAFDPVFMLHHTMVDRVWAMWQGLNPHAWIEPHIEIMGSYTLKVGQVVDSTTSLSPFHDAQGKLYSSDDVRRTETFGYVYAETLRADNATAREYRLSIIEAINSLYAQENVEEFPATSTSQGWNITHTSTSFSIESTSAPGDASATTGTTPLTPGDATVAPTSLFTVSSVASSTHSAPETASFLVKAPGTAPKNGSPRRGWGSVHRRAHSRREYLVMLKVSKDLLDKPFFVHVFLGLIPTSPPQDWCFASNLVGSHAVFSSVAGDTTGSGDSRGCVTSTIPLTAKLTSRIGAQTLADFDVVQATEYMQRNLRYRIVTADGEVVEVARLVDGGIVVDVASALVQARASDSEFPSWGPIERMFSLDPEM